VAEVRYVYAIVRATAALPAEVRGIDGEPLELISHGDLGAVVGQMARPPIRTRERLRRHKAVVEAVRRGNGTLPVRFGTVFAGERQIVDSLVRKHDALRDDLLQLGGELEFDLLVLSSPAVPGSWESQEEEARQPGDGGRCAAGNERAEERLRAATGPIDAVLGEHARESRWTFRGARPVACSAAYLISRSATDRFLGAFTRLCAERRDFSLILGKPLAPYSFVSIADRAPPGVASPRESVASAQESGASLRG
jgi:hypothetical protein